MTVYRIVQDVTRAKDLSGTGAYRYGGRWNSKGTYVLYTSENSSLAYLESLVHFDKIIMPPALYLVKLNVDDQLPVYIVSDMYYQNNWKKLGLIQNQKSGDRWLREQQRAVIKVKSAINELEYNYLLNPLYPRFHELVKVVSQTQIDVDARLV